MYGIFTNIWVIYGANVGKYSIHGSYGANGLFNVSHILLKEVHCTFLAVATTRILVLLQFYLVNDAMQTSTMWTPR